MHPYWAPLVFSYLFGVRVVVITRTTKPKENATKPSHLMYVHTTKIFDFNNDEYQQNKDTYIPVTSYEKCVRLSDASFNSKPTIELLYLTGYKFSHVDKSKKVVRVKDDNHFLFLRRVLCVRIPPNLPLSDESLRKTLIKTQQPQFEANLMEEDSAPSPPQPEEAGPVPERPPPPVDLIEPVNDETMKENIAIENPPSHLLQETNDPLPERKSCQKKSKKKKVHKKKHYSKVTKERSTSTLQVNDDNDIENQSMLSNTELVDNILYDADSQCFFTAQFDTSLRRYLNKTLVEDLTTINQDLLNNARNTPNNWVSIPLGSSTDDLPPVHLTTTVKCLYEQLDSPYCITYCMASALFYCGFKTAARRLAAQASLLAPLHRMAQIESLKGFMPNNVPSIGGATIFGKRCMGNKKKKRKFTWSDLFETITPYPTLVVPVTKDGKMNHAFCVVDDLIFDSSVPYALKLVKASVDWIYHYQTVDIFMALRFNQKVSPKGHKVRWTYKRKIEENWIVSDESSQMAHNMTDSSINKAYDVEYIAPQSISKMTSITNY
jgi:hypothetical protein